MYFERHIEEMLENFVPLKSDEKEVQLYKKETIGVFYLYNSVFYTIADREPPPSQQLRQTITYIPIAAHP